MNKHVVNMLVGLLMVNVLAAKPEEQPIDIMKIVGTWRKYDSGTEFTFTKDMKVLSPNPRVQQRAKGQWEIKDGNVVMWWSDGVKVTLDIVSDILLMGNGKTNDIWKLEKRSNNSSKPEKPKPVFTNSIVEFHGHRYQVVLGRVTWHEAKMECETRGGHLVIISDSEENEFVRKLCKQRNMWIGLTEEVKHGEWRWVDGTLMKFTDFKGVEPNNQNGREHYAHFCFRADNFFSDQWNDLSDDGEGFIQGYICEWDK